MTLVDLIGKLPAHATKRYPTRDLSVVTRGALHHTGGPAWATPPQIARFHVESNHLEQGGAPGIAYHYLVGPDGTVYKCWPATTITWCVRKGNTPTVCVCMIGHFDERPSTLTAFEVWALAAREIPLARMSGGFYHRPFLGGGPPPPAQWAAAAALMRELASAYNIRDVYGHKEVPTMPPQTTACPGRFVDLNRFRSEVLAP